MGMPDRMGGSHLFFYQPRVPLVKPLQGLEFDSGRGSGHPTTTPYAIADVVVQVPPAARPRAA